MDETKETTPAILIASSRPRPRALKAGTLRFGNAEADCYVMADGTAYLSTRGIQLLVAGTESGNFRRLIDRITAKSQGFSLEPGLEFLAPANNAVIQGYTTEAVVALCAQMVALFFQAHRNAPHAFAGCGAFRFMGPAAPQALSPAGWSASPARGPGERRPRPRR